MKHHRMARLLEIISLIRSDRNLRPADLAEHFNISVKRIHDDITDLSIAQVPIYFENTGYKIMPTFSFPALNFNTEETCMIALALKLLMRESQTKVHSRRLETILHKISSSLPKGTDKNFQQMLKHIDVSDTASTSGIKSSIFQKLTEAITTRREIKIVYSSVSSDRKIERILCPYAITYRKNSWYVIAHCHVRNEVRTFKIARIEKATITKTPYEPDPKFNVEKYFGHSWWLRSGEEIKVKVWFSKAIAPIIMEKENNRATFKKQRNGSVIMNSTVGHLEEFSWWLIQYGTNAEAIEPPELRELMSNTARQLAELYEE